jgi:hypothetical protein
VDSHKTAKYPIFGKENKTEILFVQNINTLRWKRNKSFKKLSARLIN